MKKYLKNQNGMAMPMVLIIMTILMILAAGIAGYAHNSLTSVKWMTDQKKAYYLARAGVEAASYAYQTAASKADSDLISAGTVSNFGDMEKIVAAAKSGDKPVVTEKVYLCYADNTNTDTKWDGLAFKKADDVNYMDGSYVGYFQVEVGKGIDIKMTKASGATTYEESPQDVVVFRSTAVCGDVTHTSYAYITEADAPKEATLYNKYGVLNHDDSNNLLTEETGSKFKNFPVTIKFAEIENLDSGHWIKRLFRGIIKLVAEWFWGTEKTFDVYTYTANGNLILNKPSNSDVIKGADNSDNFYVILSENDLFINAGVEALPEKGKYESYGLYGDEIVVDGNITMSVYITNPDSLLGDRFQSTVAMLGNRFRLGTVILGHPTADDPTDRDPLSVSQGGIQINGVKKGANKVFFNGNVTLKVYTQGASTETFRIFNAGDIAYFYGNYTESTAINSSEEVTSKGIDLLKFFIDAVEADAPGFRYGESVKDKVKQIKQTYYGADDTEYVSYITDDTVLMRKVIVENKSGNIYVDGLPANVTTLIQQNPYAASSLVWGRPRHGDVWNGFQKGAN